MNERSKIAAAVTAALCTLAFGVTFGVARDQIARPLLESVDAARRSAKLHRHRPLVQLGSAQYYRPAGQGRVGRFLDLRLLQLCQHAAARHSAL